MRPTKEHQMTKKKNQQNKKDWKTIEVFLLAIIGTIGLLGTINLEAEFMTFLFPLVTFFGFFLGGMRLEGIE